MYYVETAESLGVPALALERAKPVNSLSFDSLQMCNALRIKYFYGSFYAQYAPAYVSNSQSDLGRPILLVKTVLGRILSV